MLDFEQIPLAADERLDKVNENIMLIQKKDGLTYGTDAYLLAAFVRSDKNALCVDLGSGTGIIPLLLCRRDKVARAVGVEVQTDFAELIGRNASLNGLHERLTPLCLDARDLTQVTLGRTLGSEQGVCADVVVANPPYMKVGNGRRNEADAKYIARHEVCGGIGDFCAAAERILRYGGSFYVVYRPDRLGELMAALNEQKLEPKRMTFVHADAESEPGMVLVEARAGGKASLCVTPPLILHDAESRGMSHRPLTEKAKRVYEGMSFED
ncbi:MAG: SAM-dependent methyltransferase [Ruminococcaceae bacterium]|nr:SAM-dependent methyltransferase [Oscillospiraceae bacterium]